MSRHAVVACPQLQAAEAAISVLEEGGNAVDAAVCGAFVQMVVDPLMCGLGGFGVALCHDADSGTTHALDFSAAAGGATRPDQWEHLALGLLADGYGYSTVGHVNDVGHQAVGVPGAVDGLGTMHGRWGRIPWAEVLQPAIRAAADGFVVNRAVYDFWTEPGALGRPSGPERVTATEEAARLYTRDGVPLPIGATCALPDQARTLEVLAAQGPRAFYEGEIANAIARDFAENGGHITLDDLNGYRTRDVDPIATAYRGRRVLGMPPPSGGVLVAQMLLFLERFDLAALPFASAERIRLIAEAMKYGIGGRVRYGSDPDVCDIPVAALVDPGAAARAAERVRDGALLDPLQAAGAAESSDTTQLTIVDGTGNAVVLTHSLGYSSGVVTPGLGFLFNNYMNCFNPLPGHVDSIQPGKRRASSMAPTLLFDEAGIAIAAGAPGATRIAPAVVQTVVNIVDHGMTPIEAVAAPRVDWQCGPIELEGRIPAATATALEAMGYEVHRRRENYDPYFARPQVVARCGTRLRGAADPRRDGGIALSTRCLHDAPRDVSRPLTRPLN